MSRKKHKSNNVVKIMSLILIMLIVVATIMFKQSDLPSEETDIQDDVEEAIEKTAAQFPYNLGDGVVVESLFQFTGMNPDCENMEGENIAAISVRNDSEEFIELAEVVVELDNEVVLEFKIKDMPAKSVVNAFEKSNQSYELTDVSTDIKGELKFKQDAGEVMEQFEIQEEETTVTIKNLSGKDLENVVVHCHCSLGDMYFGGLTYDYPVEKIAAGEIVTIEALECYLGEAVVVDISKK